MSYSCSDFADDVLSEFVRLDLVKEADIENDDPSQQADLVLAGLKRLQTQRADLLAALESAEKAIKDALEGGEYWQENFAGADLPAIRAAIAKARG